MKHFYIIFSLCWGAIPSYIFTSPPGTKFYGKYDPDEEDQTIDQLVPASFDIGVHAILVDQKTVADAIKIKIEEFAEKGYGDIKLEIVEDLKESELWNGGTIPTDKKQARIDFTYVDSTLPLQIPTPSVTKTGDLNCKLGDTLVELTVALHSQLPKILADLLDKINAVAGYTAELVENSIVIQSTEESPSFTWDIKTEAENIIYPSDPIFNGEKSLTLEFSYADELAPAPLPTPSTTSAGVLVYKIGDTTQSVEVINNDVIADINAKLKTNIDLVADYSADIVDDTLVITSKLETPSFEWILPPAVSKIAKNKVTPVIPENLEFTKEVIFVAV